MDALSSVGCDDYTVDADGDLDIGVDVGVAIDLGVAIEIAICEGDFNQIWRLRRLRPLRR